ncbi:MAG TPA: nucleoside-diphosphate kinase, partial [Actinobacteria bacterium]|nr:nucleoside-diphosphate kinase [Actinomycetota bacterium]
MADQSTLFIVKPDAVRRGLVGEILTRIERKGLRVEAMKLMRIDRALAERHYAEHTEKPFFGDLVAFITSGDAVVGRLTGRESITVWRDLMGS